MLVSYQECYRLNGIDILVFSVPAFQRRHKNIDLKSCFVCWLMKCGRRIAGIGGLSMKVFVFLSCLGIKAVMSANKLKRPMDNYISKL